MWPMSSMLQTQVLPCLMQVHRNIKFNLIQYSGGNSNLTDLTLHWIISASFDPHISQLLIASREYSNSFSNSQCSSPSPQAAYTNLLGLKPHLWIWQQYATFITQVTVTTDCLNNFFASTALPAEETIHPVSNYSQVLFKIFPPPLPKSNWGWTLKQ